MVRLHVWGPRACFVRPELKLERVSYDVMTPAAARGILASIYEYASSRWQVDRIHVLKPIAFTPILSDSLEAPAINRLSNQSNSSVSRRVAIVLTDVAYVIEARLVWAESGQEIGNWAQHLAIFAQRINERSWSRAPCLGLRNFPANLALLRDGDHLPPSQFPLDAGPVDLGWTFYDIDRRSGRLDLFFRAKIINGVVIVPPLDSSELAA